jgi:hypothetical protein
MTPLPSTRTERDALRAELRRKAVANAVAEAERDALHRHLSLKCRDMGQHAKAPNGCRNSGPVGCLCECHDPAEENPMSNLKTPPKLQVVTNQHAEVDGNGWLTQAGVLVLHYNRGDNRVGWQIQLAGMPADTWSALQDAIAAGSDRDARHAVEVENLRRWAKARDDWAAGLAAHYGLGPSEVPDSYEAIRILLATAGAASKGDKGVPHEPAVESELRAAAAEALAERDEARQVSEQAVRLSGMRADVLLTVLAELERLHASIRSALVPGITPADFMTTLT